MNSDMTTQSNNFIETISAKTAYQKPELVIYGNISEITRTVDNKGKNADGGMGKTDKT